MLLFASAGMIKPKPSKTTGVKMLAISWKMSSVYIPIKHDISVTKKHQPPTNIPKPLLLVKM